MRAVVIGAAGFIGSALVDHLAAAGDEVLAMDCGSTARPHDSVRYAMGSVIDGPLPLEGAEAVYYLAQSAAYRQFPERAADLLGVNVVGAVRACAAARAAGAKCFLYTSTGNVYAPSFGPLSEDAPLRRDDPYALSKLMAEETLALLHPQPNVVIARLFGVFGPGQRTMLPVLLRQRIERGEPILLHGAPDDAEPSGGLRISFTFVADVVRRLRDLAVLAASGQAPQIVNLAGPEPLSVRQFATALASALRREPRFETQSTLRSFDLHADIARLTAVCPYGFTPFDAAIEATLR